MVVKRGYCRNASYLKVKEGGPQIAKLDGALRLYGNHVTSLAYICGSIGSQYRNSNDTLHMLDTEY